VAVIGPSSRRRVIGWRSVRAFSITYSFDENTIQS
jgi:hypothetical protein